MINIILLVLGFSMIISVVLWVKTKNEFFFALAFALLMILFPFSLVGE